MRFSPMSESVGLTFAKAFIAGEILPFPCPIEDSKPFLALVEAHSERNASIESAVMELAHGSCHDLSVGLANALNLSHVMVIIDSGFPVHSGLYDEERQFLLDANGVHTLDDALRFWSGIVKRPCSALLMEIYDLLAFSGSDEDAESIALEDFCIVAQFIYDEGLSNTVLNVPA